MWVIFTADPASSPVIVTTLAVAPVPTEAVRPVIAFIPTTKSAANVLAVTAPLASTLVIVTSEFDPEIWEVGAANVVVLKFTVCAVVLSGPCWSLVSI